MLLLALAFFAAGIFVLKAKRPPVRSTDSRLYRIDNRAVSTVLFIIGLCLLVLSWAQTRPPS